MISSKMWYYRPLIPLHFSISTHIYIFYYICNPHRLIQFRKIEFLKLILDLWRCFLFFQILVLCWPVGSSWIINKYDLTMYKKFRSKYYFLTRWTHHLFILWEYKMFLRNCWGNWSTEIQHKFLTECSLVIVLAVIYSRRFKSRNFYRGSICTGKRTSVSLYIIDLEAQNY